MVWFLIALTIYLACGLASLAAGRRPLLANRIGAAGPVLAGGLVAFESIRGLVAGNIQSLRLAWSLPFGSLRLAMDPLSAVFAATIALVTALAAIYGNGYLKDYAGRKNLGASWFFFNVLAASMLLVVASRNGALFLLAWELMSLASFFLVMFEDEKESVRRAGWVYLVAMHLGTAFLTAMFLLLSRSTGSFDFNDFVVVPGEASVLFVLAVIGFGTKAGFFPMHVWLPEAHPAAPSHVSAVMSGVMIKTGIYGLLRMLIILGPPPVAWGWTLVVIGVVSGCLGVLYALSQQDLKRLLAYCSMENIGIIAMGLGIGLLGVSYQCPAMAVLGFTGGLLHVVNHAVFKSLLFLGAGSVLHGTGTLDIDRLGGLLRRMPVTGATFVIGAAAISGLPPLNGFVSEFLIYLGAISGLDNEPLTAMAWPLMGVLTIGGLALIGGLAAVCFTKAFGIAFLGEPRSPEATHAHEANAAMRWPMMTLAGLCVVIGLLAPLWPIGLQPAVTALIPMDMRATATANARLALDPLLGVTLGSYLLLGFMVLILSIRRKLLAGRRVDSYVTWDCGYVAVTPRVQYTGSSFVRPVSLLFRLFLQPRDVIHPPKGLFPKEADLHTHTPDLFRHRVYQPIFMGVAWLASKLRWLQQGWIQIYVLYIALTILVLLIWKLR